MRCFLPSVARSRGDAGQWLGGARGPWSMENRPHSVREVTLGEDASRIRKGSGPQVKAALRHAAIGFLRATGTTNLAESLRRNVSRVADVFTRLGILNQ